MSYAKPGVWHRTYAHTTIHHSIPFTLACPDYAPEIVHYAIPLCSWKPTIMLPLCSHYSHTNLHTNWNLHTNLHTKPCPAAGYGISIGNSHHAAADDDLPMSQLRTRMLAEPLQPPPPSQSQLFGEQMITILRDGLRQQLIDGASGKLGQHRAPRTGLGRCSAGLRVPINRRLIVRMNVATRRWWCSLIPIGSCRFVIVSFQGIGLSYTPSTE